MQWKGFLLLNIRLYSRQGASSFPPQTESTGQNYAVTHSLKHWKVATSLTEMDKFQHLSM